MAMMTDNTNIIVDLSIENRDPSRAPAFSYIDID